MYSAQIFYACNCSRTCSPNNGGGLLSSVLLFVDITSVRYICSYNKDQSGVYIGRGGGLYVFVISSCIFIIVLRYHTGITLPPPPPKKKKMLCAFLDIDVPMQFSYSTVPSWCLFNTNCFRLYMIVELLMWGRGDLPFCLSLWCTL